MRTTSRGDHGNNLTRTHNYLHELIGEAAFVARGDERFIPNPRPERDQ